MFRKPRENPSSTETVLKPSVGRPPTPPNGIEARQLPATMTTRTTKPFTPRPSSTLLGQSTTKKIAYGKTSRSSNGNILNFFKKVDSPQNESIFLSQGSPADKSSSRPSSADFFAVVDDIYDADDGRYNEGSGSVKRRKVSRESMDMSGSIGNGQDGDKVRNIPLADDITTKPPLDRVAVKSKPRRKGPFLEDSDSELDDQVKGRDARKKDLNITVLDQSDAMNEAPVTKEIAEHGVIVTPLESTKSIEKGPYLSLSSRVGSDMTNNTFDGELSKAECYDNTLPINTGLKSVNFGDFDLEDFPDDEFADGEEFTERKWMEEQVRLETEQQDYETFNDNVQAQSACPICNINLDGITTDQASRHVNACLDGNPTPLPQEAEPVANTHFSRTAIAKPGQASPFGNTAVKPSSAFSKLMSSHAEDVAWANAAATENAARGKPAYQRTCPFYKIMPGFFICVDAFRYGAIQGCNAYFLSHFHSDHYVGLTSTWCHGPIYCSKVTANLVKQQLRVDPKWVVALDFEANFEVPATQGVTVTMIPANHCPGSSLFLFEKVIGSAKIHRVLHCGDFRACPTHVAHPLLMPDIVDSITGKAKQQKIDVCYLDTTYLNPRYSFPSQEDVISACADMCVSLKKERAEESDAWEIIKKERAGMTKCINTTVKSEVSTGTKPRGRLLVICGTYSIGKERICIGIARALDCKIWAPPGKIRICAALEDEELMSRMTDDPREAQIHMQMLMEIRAETLQDYLNGFKPHFSRIVGFRPSGWNYRPPNSRFVESPSIPTVLYSDSWKSRYTMTELIPQRGSTREASCFGVPYSEHSSFRELTIFVCALRIEKVIPTVNVGSATGRAKMKGWIEKWMAERRKNGCVVFGKEDGEVEW